MSAFLADNKLGNSPLTEKTSTDGECENMIRTNLHQRPPRQIVAPRAFTLIEMLVVIAIIAVLAAVLFPVFATAKSSGKHGEGLENLRQLTQGAAMYAHDSDERYMSVGCPAFNLAWTPAQDPNVDASGNPWSGWGTKIAPYLSHYEVMELPAVPIKAKFTGDCAKSDGLPVTNSFTFNWMLGSDGTYGKVDDKRDPYAWSPDQSRRFSMPVYLADIESPKNTVSFFTSGANLPSAANWGCLFVTIQSSDFSNKLQQNAFKDDGANIAFVDGSVRFIKDSHMDPNFVSAGRQWGVYHLKSKGVWMEPTMPTSSMGFKNRDADGQDVGDL